MGRLRVRLARIGVAQYSCDSGDVTMVLLRKTV
jgi:hypothetical protein